MEGLIAFRESNSSMANSNDDELSLDKLKVVNGGFKGDAQCEDKMGQAKGYRKVATKPSWTKKPDNWSGIEMQENSTANSANQ